MMRIRKPTLLSVEPLEGRVLLAQVLPRPASVHVAGNTSDGSGYPAILAAINGGVGSEFVTLIRRGVPNLGLVIRQFLSGQRDSLTVKGFAAGPAKFQPLFQGARFDQFKPVAVGAALLRDGRLELAAIVDGPIDYPLATTFVWGINRGTATNDPEGFGQANLRYDAIVSVTRAADATVTASVKDLKTGTVTPINASAVTIEGATIRVFLQKPSEILPSTGKSIAQYKVAFWTRTGPGGIETVGAFMPPSGSILVGILGKVPK